VKVRPELLVGMIRPAVPYRHDAWHQAPKATVQPLLINMTPPITQA